MKSLEGAFEEGKVRGQEPWRVPGRVAVVFVFGLRGVSCDQGQFQASVEVEANYRELWRK